MNTNTEMFPKTMNSRHSMPKSYCFIQMKRIPLSSLGGGYRIESDYSTTKQGIRLVGD